MARVMKGLLTTENALSTLEVAQLLGADAMKNCVLDYILLHFREVIDREELSSVPPSLLVDLLRWKASLDPV